MNKSQLTESLPQIEVTPPILEANNIVVKKGGAIVLDIPHFSIEQGKHLSLIGPNGAGKSTLLLTLSNLLKLQSGNTSGNCQSGSLRQSGSLCQRGCFGEIYFKGNKIDLNYRSALAYRRNISMVFHEPLLFDTTVFNNVASGLKIRGIKLSEIQKVVDEYLDRFGISHLSNRSAKKLSGGEAKRTSLARAFATKPEILFLDEPFTFLDLPTRESLIEDLAKNMKEIGTTTIMSTHDQMEALQLSDCLMVMNQGKIVQSGLPEEVISNPANKFVASFGAAFTRRG